MLPTRRFPMPEPTSTVTINVQDHIAAVEKAWENAVPVKSGGKTRAGHDVPSPAPKQLLPGGHYVAAALFDGDGKVVGVV